MDIIILLNFWTESLNFQSFLSACSRIWSHIERTHWHRLFLLSSETMFLRILMDFRFSFRSFCCEMVNIVRLRLRLWITLLFMDTDMEVAKCFTHARFIIILILPRLPAPFRYSLYICGGLPSKWKEKYWLAGNKGPRLISFNNMWCCTNCTFSQNFLYPQPNTLPTKFSTVFEIYINLKSVYIGMKFCQIEKWWI